jgi:sensor histidine kinase YesM
MNPHFYFNTLNSINSFILKNDMLSANRFLTTFARLMREILENSQKEFVTIQEEAQVLHKYLTLQQLRFPELFDFTIHTEDIVKDKKIPPMVLQPFVENAVEYAFHDMKTMGHIVISFKIHHNGVLCSVTDNGIGIKKARQFKQRHNKKSTAIKNIYGRIDMLNKIYKIAISLNIGPLSEEDLDFPGTSVKLIIPDFDLLK